MSALERETLVDKACSHLRRGAAAGLWTDGRIPSLRTLSAELGIAQNTLLRALRRLDMEGFFTGSGLERRIAPAFLKPARRPGLRIGILPAVAFRETGADVRRMFFDLRQRLEAEGHSVVVTKSREELHRSLRRVTNLVKATRVDAWLVMDGERDLLEWFSASGLPVMAFGGNVTGLPVSTVGTSVGGAMRDAVHALSAAGHRRIVLLTGRPTRGEISDWFSAHFRRVLEAEGGVAGEFNVPKWDGTPRGLNELLASLFRLTPPTALIVSEHRVMLGVQGFLMTRGIRVPSQVSLVDMEREAEGADWFIPSHARIHNDYETIGDFIFTWAKGLAAGRREPVARILPATYIPGGTVGPAPRRGTAD